MLECFAIIVTNLSTYQTVVKMAEIEVVAALMLELDVGLVSYIIL